MKSGGQSWYATPAFLRVAIGALALWFIRRAKGPDKTQRELIEKAKELK